VKAVAARDDLQIFALGSFDVRKDGQSLVNASARSYRLWDLFKYVLAHREKSAMVDVLIELLWSEKDCADPYNALKTQMYRLRKLLGQGRDLASQYILYANNSYKLNSEASIWLDTDAFEGLVEQGRRAREMQDYEEAFKSYSRAVRLYKGPYLMDSPFSEWLLNARNRYHRLYIEAVTEVLDYLALEKRHDDLAAWCEEAFRNEYFEESWHCRYLEALLHMGKQRLARSHYENLASVYKRQLGAMPSEELRQISRRILGERLDSGESLESITRSFRQEADDRGAFTCEPDTFRRLYELEIRRNERNGQAVFLGMIYLEAGYPKDGVNKGSNPARDSLAESIITGLRRGDVVTEWRPSQYLVLLPGLNFEQAERVLDRVTAPAERAGIRFNCDLLPLHISDLIERMESCRQGAAADLVPA